METGVGNHSLPFYPCAPRLRQLLITTSRRGLPIAAAPTRAALEPAGFGIKRPFHAPRRSTPYQRVFPCCRRPPGDPGNGERRRCPCFAKGAEGHFPAPSARSPPHAFSKYFGNIQKLVLGVVASTLTKPRSKPRGGAGDRRHRLRRPAAGAGLGGDQAPVVLFSAAARVAPRAFFIRRSISALWKGKAAYSPRRGGRRSSPRNPPW